MAAAFVAVVGVALAVALFYLLGPWWLVGCAALGGALAGWLDES